jgi:hypothetical protein
MTHDELVAVLNDYDIGLSNGMVHKDLVFATAKALRAVVELHNCSNKYCGNCGMASPCFTIEAIQKELF